MKKVTIDNLASEISKDLAEYANVVAEDVKDAVEEVAKQAVKDIKANAPKNTGKYKSGWTKKQVKRGSETVEIVIYNKNKPQLTHLLEKGHAKVGGGRVEGKPHIAPAEEAAEKSLLGKVKVLVQ